MISLILLFQNSNLEPKILMSYIFTLTRNPLSRSHSLTPFSFFHLLSITLLLRSCKFTPPSSFVWTCTFSNIVAKYRHPIYCRFTTFDDHPLSIGCKSSVWWWFGGAVETMIGFGGGLSLKQTISYTTPNPKSIRWLLWWLEE